MPELSNIRLTVSASSGSSSLVALRYGVLFHSNEIGNFLLTATLEGIDSGPGLIERSLATFTRNEVISRPRFGYVEKSHSISVLNSILNEDRSGRDELQAWVFINPTAGTLVVDSDIVRGDF